MVCVFFYILESEIPSVLFLKTLNSLIWVKEIKNSTVMSVRWDKTQHLLFWAPIDNWAVVIGENIFL